jgi:hypothetical protein
MGIEYPDVYKRYPRWILMTFSAQEVDYSNFLLTSEPPKKHLRFVLDDTGYETVVTLRVHQNLTLR